MVRVRQTQETQALRLTGLVGTVCGASIPSMPGIEVIPAPLTDYAVAVRFSDLDATRFLPHDVLEFIRHGPDQRAGFQSEQGNVTWVRWGSGEWQRAREAAGNRLRITPEFATRVKRPACGVRRSVPSLRVAYGL